MRTRTACMLMTHPRQSPPCLSCLIYCQHGAVTSVVNAAAIAMRTTMEHLTCAAVKCVALSQRSDCRCGPVPTVSATCYRCVSLALGAHAKIIVVIAPRFNESHAITGRALINRTTNNVMHRSTTCSVFYLIHVYPFVLGDDGRSSYLPTTFCLFRYYFSCQIGDSRTLLRKLALPMLVTFCLDSR